MTIFTCWSWGKEAAERRAQKKMPSGLKELELQEKRHAEAEG